MKLKIKNIALLFKEALKNWWSKDPFKESAVIAYYAVFSLPGLLVVIMTISGYFLGSESVNEQLQSQIASTMGPDTAKQIHDMIEVASESRNSVWAAIIGIVTILVGATGVFVQFQKSLNIIWEVKADEKKSGIMNFLRLRLFSFGLILAIAFIMMVSLVITTLLMTMGNWLSSHFSDFFLTMVQVINFIASRIIIALLFALMFKFLPDAKVKWKHVWLGSLVTAFLFLFGIYGLSLYFGKTDPGAGYGAAGSIILILLWVSYSSMIVFYGAEFTHAYAVKHDGYIQPTDTVVKQIGRKR